MPDLKPSNIGLCNIPQSPNRRTSRAAGVKLDQINDEQEEGWFHPTKGYRKISPKRAMAAKLTQEMKTGQQSYSTLQLKRMLNAIIRGS